MSSFKELSKNIIRKFVDVISCFGLQVETENGWNDIESINKTVEYNVYEVSFDNGRTIKCADNHIFITEDGSEIFAKDSENKRIRTKKGIAKVVYIRPLWYKDNMYDLSVSGDHLYYTNGILSHNTTLMTIYTLWLANFYPDQNIIIIANNDSTALMIFEKIRLAYLELPGWIKTPIDQEFNKKSLKLTNGSKITTSPTTDSAIRRKCRIMSNP